ncbi:MAG: PKD domain-containing protein [Saprospiraceae bacterium]|nr:PKD domain-containing protein [Lewinella sp.]
MRNLITLNLFLIGACLILTTSSCEKEEMVEAPTAGIFRSIAGKQVAFSALTLNADQWQWDFGDGNNSQEKNPVHIYDQGGIYTITLTATNSVGTAQATTQVSLDLTPYEMLTGGPNDPDGKTWRISAAHSDKDAIALANADMTVIQEVPQGALGLFLGLGEEYEDEFTFKADGSYIHDNKNGGSFGGLVFALVTQTPIVNITDESQGFGFASLAFTPESGATFTYTAEKDLTITAVDQNNDSNTYEVTYPGVSTLSFSGNEFIGFMGFHRECIIQEITPEKMRLAMFMSATQGANFNKPSLVVIFTFEAVN